MNISETYDYLVRARRDLWVTLEGVREEVLSRTLLGSSRFHCIKDPVMHIPDVEDGWIHLDILRAELMLKATSTLKDIEGAHQLQPLR